MNSIFSYTGARLIVFGKGSFATLPQQITELGASRPLVIIDAALAKSGLAEKVRALFGEKKIACHLFDGVAGEPALELADECGALAREHRCDCVIGIGGGSAMDVAKAAAVVATNSGKAAEYLGLNKIPARGLPKIMVPTTAGTGSEVTFTSVFIRKDLKKKEGMNSPFLYPEVALLDPLLTLSVPPAVTAMTGLDAFCHAVESYTSIKSNPMSEMVSLKAIELIAAHLRTCVHDGSNEEAREQMMLASLYAGLGLANAGVTAVHSLSYPLGGRYGVPHGLANTLLLVPTMRFNLPGAIEKLAIVAEVMGVVLEPIPSRDAAEWAIDEIQQLIEDCGITVTLRDQGVKEADFHAIAEIAMTVARPLANNPRKVTIEDAVAIYAEAY
jgi:alcohol dehydrogenase